MKNDPAIDSIRQTRHEISEEFKHDTKALIEHYKVLQKKYADRLARNETGSSSETEDRSDLSRSRP